MEFHELKKHDKQFYINLFYHEKNAVFITEEYINKKLENYGDNLTLEIIEDDFDNAHNFSVWIHNKIRAKKY